MNNSCGGGEGIRTLETLADLPAFQASALDHYATPPELTDCTGSKPNVNNKKALQMEGFSISCLLHQLFSFLFGHPLLLRHGAEGGSGDAHFLHFTSLGILDPLGDEVDLETSLTRSI